MNQLLEFCICHITPLNTKWLWGNMERINMVKQNSISLMHPNRIEMSDTLKKCTDRD